MIHNQVPPQDKHSTRATFQQFKVDLTELNIMNVSVEKWQDSIYAFQLHYSWCLAHTALNILKVSHWLLIKEVDPVKLTVLCSRYTHVCITS